MNIKPETITKTIKELFDTVDYGIKSPILEVKFSKIEMKNKICINVFHYEHKWTYIIYISNQKFENSIDLLKIFDCSKSHYVYIKEFKIYVSQNKKQKQIFLQKLFAVF